MLRQVHALRIAPFLVGLLAAGVPTCPASLAGAEAMPVANPDTRPNDTRPTDTRPAIPGNNWWDNTPGPQQPAGQPQQPPVGSDGPYLNGNGGGGTYRYHFGNDYPGSELQNWVVANTLAARARAVFRRADSELATAIRRAQQRFERSRDYQDALAAEQQAYADYNAAREKALASLNDNAKYRAVAKLRDELGTKLTQMRASKSAAREDVLAMATLKMQYASDVRALEVTALDNSDVHAAREKMVAASRRLADLRSRADDSIRDSSEVAMARRNLEDARVAVIESDTYAYSSAVASAAALNYSYYLHRMDQGYYAPYGPAATGGGGYYSPYWH